MFYGKCISNKRSISNTLFNISGSGRRSDTRTEHILDRGYTGHEHLDHFGLINMNGRVYDAMLARFLSPDPMPQDLSHTQSFNRYSYVLNNPLKYIDPSGYYPATIRDIDGDSPSVG